MEEQRIVGVRLEDLCKIADAVDSMKGDLNNGKWKYLEFEIDSIHEIVRKMGCRRGRTGRWLP